MFLNLEDFQDMVECIEARLIVEANEMQQLIRARALFTLDEKYKENFKFNEIKDFDELKLEEEKYSEYGA